MKRIKKMFSILTKKNMHILSSMLTSLTLAAQLQYFLKGSYWNISSPKYRYKLILLVINNKHNSQYKKHLYEKEN